VNRGDTRAPGPGSANGRVCIYVIRLYDPYVQLWPLEHMLWWDSAYSILEIFILDSQCFYGSCHWKMIRH